MIHQLQKIEEILNIKFEEYDRQKEQDNVYKYFGPKDNIEILQIKNVVIDDISILLALSKKLFTLRLINCTIGDISSLIYFEMLEKLTLDNVSLPNIDTISQKVPTITSKRSRTFHVDLKNMTIRHLFTVVPTAKDLSISNCTIHNFYEINLLPHLYALKLDAVTIEQSDADVIHQAIAERRLWRLDLHNMELAKLNVFIPIAEKLEKLELEICQIDSIREIHQFSKLKCLDIDSKTIIKDRELSKDNTTSFQIEKCVLTEYHSGPNAFFDLQNLASIAPYIKSFSFYDYASRQTDYWSNFSQLETLVFEESTVPLGDFLALAAQIKSLTFRKSKFTQSELLKDFKQLEEIKFGVNNQDNGLEDFKKLLPLKHQLKKLDTDEEEIKNLAYIKEFTALESLRLTTTSAEVAQSIFSLNTLRRLWLYIYIDPEPETALLFDLKALKNIEGLLLSSPSHLHLRGIEQLSQIERLWLECNCQVEGLDKLKKLKYLTLDNDLDINKIPAINSLQTLELSTKGTDAIHSLEKFPNLEKLKIDARSKINLGKLDKLKVLSIQFLDPEIADCFNELPNLEKLDLSYSGIALIKNLDKLTNLKMLDLSENQELKNIEGLENLKNLEYLNLYGNQISDISVLNKLPNLKEVNLADNCITKEEVHTRLDKPELAIFLYSPYSHFRIWDDNYFEL